MKSWLPLLGGAILGAMVLAFAPCLWVKGDPGWVLWHRVQFNFSDAKTLPWQSWEPIDANESRDACLKEATRLQAETVARAGKGLVQNRWPAWSGARKATRKCKGITSSSPLGARKVLRRLTTTCASPPAPTRAHATRSDPLLTAKAPSLARFRLGPGHGGVPGWCCRRPRRGTRRPFDRKRSV